MKNEVTEKFRLIREVLNQATDFVQKSPNSDESIDLYAYLEGAAENLGEIEAALAANSAPGQALDHKRFEQAPCYICGYNGAGYFQPGQHECAKLWHGFVPAAEPQTKENR